MTFVSVPTYLEKTTHSTPADPQIRSANAPDARHGDALADAGIVVRPLAAADFQAVMDAYYQQWGMEDDGDPVVSGWWTAALFEKASFGCLAWKGDELFGAAVGHARSMKKLELGSSWKSSVVWAQEAVDKLGGEAMALLDEISICNRRLAQRAQADGRRFAAELDFLWVSPKPEEWDSASAFSRKCTPSCVLTALRNMRFSPITTATTASISVSPGRRSAK